MPRPAESTSPRLPGISLAALLLAACAGTAPNAPRPAAPTPAAPSAPAPAVPAGAASLPAEAPAPAPGPDGLHTVLAYAQQLRTLPAADLAAELEQLRQRTGAAAWLQASLVHAHRQPPELQRALELATQAAQDGSPEGESLQALARLLAARYADQRRLEEQLERQGRQLADVQRRLDQSLERLEALKAIERSLGGRAGRPQDRTLP